MDRHRQGLRPLGLQEGPARATWSILPGLFQLIWRELNITETIWP